MDVKTAGPRALGYVKILIATNIVTLIVLLAVIIRQPEIPPSLDRMEKMIEAQDWFIGKMSGDLVEMRIELVKLGFGMDKAKMRPELDGYLESYEDQRAEWVRDLDASRQRIEAEFHERYPEHAESDISDTTEDTDFVR